MEQLMNKQGQPKSDLLPLNTMFNLRDMGGIPTLNGSITKYGVFLRGDDPVNLTKEDIQYLKNYGVTTVVDLRTSGEWESRPNPCYDIADIAYHQVTLGTDSVGDITQFMNTKNPDLLGDFYIQMLTQQQDRFKKIFQNFANNTTGASMFHCSAGKDRTGVVAMLLLDLAGVNSFYICQNYSYSFDNIMRNPLVRNTSTNLPRVLLYSKPETMERVVQMLHQTYGSARNYLIATGCRSSELDSILNRFLQEDEK